MAFNRYIDRDFDSANPRTRKRELPAGIVTTRAVLLFVIINSILFMMVAWFINFICFILSPVALAVILGYSLSKRFTSMSHLILGTGLALAPLGAWLAVTARFDLPPILMAVAVLFWVAGFDIIYALQDETFDKTTGLHSIPARWGRRNSLRLSALIHSLCFISLCAASWTSGLSLVGWAGTLIFGILLLYQHLIISTDNISRVNLAFFTTNGVASIVWALFVIMDIYLF